MSCPPFLSETAIPLNESFPLFTAIRIAVWVIGLPIIVLLLISIGRKLRAIVAEDRRLKEEAAQNAQNPYADMARMYEAKELLEKARRGK